MTGRRTSPPREGNDVIIIRAPTSLKRLVKTLAIAKGQPVAEWVRRAIILQLRTDGMRVPAAQLDRWAVAVRTGRPVGAD